MNDGENSAAVAESHDSPDSHSSQAEAVSPVVAVDLSKYDWGVRHRKNAKFDGKCFEGRLVHPYTGQDVTCLAETLPLCLKGLQQLVTDAEEAQAKYLKGRKTPAE